MDKKLIVIIGPTGVGKTDLSIEIALAFNAPIVSSDSRQIYKEMSIGTAVPSFEQLSKVPHYFIQSKSVTENYTAGKYEKEALSVLKQLFKDHDYIVLVGGSGLYIDALCNGIDEIPVADAILREQLCERLEKYGIENLLEELAVLDHDFYETIDKSNSHRVIRALEVCISTGKPYSSLRLGAEKLRDFDVIRIGINMPRDILYDRINRRVDVMIENGLLEEVRSLIPYREVNALRTVGYKEIFEYLDGKLSMSEAVDIIKRNSRRYAKRQLTWFNKNKETKWFCPEELSEIISFIRKYGL